MFQFRSSLTKAFGKNKSSGNLSNGCHELPPTDPAPSSGIENINHLVKHRSISTSALDESMIEELQRQLSAKDDLLTETRLEALSSASQLQGKPLNCANWNLGFNPDFGRNL